MATTFHELTSKEFASLGFWAIPMFSILFLAFLPVWVVGLTTLRNIKTQVLFLKYKIAQRKLLLLFIHRWIYVKLLFLWGFDFWDFVLIMILFRPILRYCLRYPGLYDPLASYMFLYVLVFITKSLKNFHPFKVTNIPSSNNLLTKKVHLRK